MKQLGRLLRYVLPYWWQLLVSVVLMAAVGLLDAFRVLLIGPIFDRVLNPSAVTHAIPLFRIPGSDRFLHLENFVPSQFQNVWTVVAFAMVTATVVKGLLDYAGTYLVNYRRVWHDYRPARPAIQRHPAPFGGFLSAPCDGHAALHPDQ
jgi:ATP-binding cassette, subfamily B, bacterial MsbA